MEEAIQEVDSVSSQNAVESETPSEGNLTIQEYASNLLKAQETEEAPEQPEEESEPAEEQTAEEEETEEQQSTEEPDESEQPEPPAEPSDVLSNKFNIDLDTLSEDEAREDSPLRRKRYWRKMPSYRRKPKPRTKSQVPNNLSS